MTETKTKTIITKHVLSQARIFEIVKEERDKGNKIVKGPTSRSNVLELEDKIIHFIVWYDSGKIWNYVNSYFGQDDIDFSEIEKEFEIARKMARLRKSLYEGK